MNHSQLLKTTPTDKLGVSIPQNLYDSLATLAVRHDRSINGEIKQAWLQWTDQLSDLKVTLALLTSQQGNKFENQISRIDLRTPSNSIKHLLCNFRKGQVHQIHEQANILMISMNSVILKALVWWVNTWRLVDHLNSSAGLRYRTAHSW